VLDWFRSYLSEWTQTFTTTGSQNNSVAVNCGGLQGSVMGSVEFIAYTKDIADLLDSHHVAYHLFVDDKQLYLSFASGQETVGVQRLMCCIAELQSRCSSRRLQLNASKTKLIGFGLRATLTIGSTVIELVNVIRDLGVLLDCKLTME